MRRLLPLLCLAPALLGCEDDPPRAAIDVRIVTTTGEDPLEAPGVARFTLAMEQTGRARTELEADADDRSAAIELGSLSADTRLRVRLESADGAVLLHGAPPTFAPISAGGLVRVLVGPPGVCEVVPEAELDLPRTLPAGARLDTFALFLAGEASGAPSSAVEFLDLLRFYPGELEDLSLAQGPARGAAVGLSTMLAVTGEGAVLYDLASADERETSLALHDGADAQSATVALPGGGALVAGGTASAGLTFVAADGSTSAATLTAPRAAPLLVPFDGGRVLVVDAAEGAEVVSAAGAPSLVDLPAFAPAAAIRDGDAVLLVGEGSDGPATLALEGCPGACVASAGPAWPMARAGVVSAGPYLVGGALVERATHGEDGWRIEPAWELARTHRAPLALLFESGVLVVVAGEDDGGPVPFVELCFPETLTEL
ncbi:MAG TPA: hypothetical protein RMH85_19655 [Polyangiaceae bacterium LLY-WYZ-15_(1-7)]|nr:hypothetical protein [Polyangiaceae bacterium LLY-WYZ-15_(1-7)]HJL10698.1 hypothetical protein [Polyangiaceae bacterium LLY-WYZ-15_(1-7)]HJL22041.1 hypothetical protein [Polyangiaceae bacterium LLY-WYZ-15_(1-7)]HJL35466.1 hypothetical protein [Polyangiaceae bacterium LLY-WYZ-15_(1-7)]